MPIHHADLHLGPVVYSSDGKHVGSLERVLVDAEGMDLKLPAESLRKANIMLRIYQVGDYRFELTVSLNDVVSPWTPWETTHST